jgi:hypothetical protein
MIHYDEKLIAFEALDALVARVESLSQTTTKLKQILGCFFEFITPVLNEIKVAILICNHIPQKY